MGAKGLDDARNYGTNRARVIPRSSMETALSVNSGVVSGLQAGNERLGDIPKHGDPHAFTTGFAIARGAVRFLNFWTSYNPPNTAVGIEKQT